MPLPSHGCNDDLHRSCNLSERCGVYLFTKTKWINDIIVLRRYAPEAPLRDGQRHRNPQPLGRSSVRKGGGVDLSKQPRELTHCERPADGGWPEFDDETALSARERQNKISVLDQTLCQTTCCKCPILDAATLQKPCHGLRYRVAHKRMSSSGSHRNCRSQLVGQ
jgi:hypothetical protein